MQYIQSRNQYRSIIEKTTNTWKLNILLNNPWVKEEVSNIHRTDNGFGNLILENYYIYKLVYDKNQVSLF